MVAIGPGAAEERPLPRRPVARRHGRQLPLDLQFACVGGQVHCARATRRGGHVLEQGVDGRRPDLAEHVRAIIGGEGQVAHSQSVPR